MMEVPVDEIVGVAAVRNRFMSTISRVSVFSVVGATGVSRGTSRRIPATFRQRVFINVPFVRVVKMAVMQIIDVTFVFNGNVSAS
jgi:hypothetical protein